MKILVELYGGPEDGRIITTTAEELAPMLEIFIPMPRCKQIRTVIKYQAIGKIKHGKRIYVFRGEV